jgi:hypothetical protein
MKDGIEVISFHLHSGFLMKRWQWALLIFELALFALILVLPQVELPEFTFHGGNAPIAAKARLSLNRVQAAVALTLPRLIPRRVLEALADIREITHLPGWDARLSLLCTLIC